MPARVLGLLDELAAPHDLWLCPDVGIRTSVRGDVGFGQLAPLGNSWPPACCRRPSDPARSVPTYLMDFLTHLPPWGISKDLLRLHM